MTATLHYPELRTSKRKLIVQLGQKEKLKFDQMIHILGLCDRGCQKTATDLAKMGFIEWNRKEKEARITQMGKEYLMKRKIQLKM